jgi:hypothetical protein
MKSALLTSLMAIALASSAHAQGGINLAWNDCSLLGTSVVTFACNTNTGIQRLYVSFVPPAVMDHLQSTNGVIDIFSSQPTLAPWWNLSDPGHAGCRNTGFDSADFTAGPFNCVDPWVGQAVSARGYSYMYNGAPDRARLQFLTTMAASEASVTTNEEYYCIKFSITYTNTVGTGACAGCLTSVCLMLQSLNLVQTQGNPSYVLTNPLVTQMVNFQPQQVAACTPVPSRNSTWGSVKALYR